MTPSAVSLSITGITTRPGGNNLTFAPAMLTYYVSTAYSYLVVDVAVSNPALGVALVNGTAGNTRNLTLAAAQSVLVTLAALGLDCPVAGPTFTFMIASGACIEWIRQR